MPGEFVTDLPFGGFCFNPVVGSFYMLKFVFCFMPLIAFPDYSFLRTLPRPRLGFFVLQPGQAGVSGWSSR
jgi:hypothetical protein